MYLVGVISITRKKTEFFFNRHMQRLNQAAVEVAVKHMSWKAPKVAAAAVEKAVKPM